MSDAESESIHTLSDRSVDTFDYSVDSDGYEIEDMALTPKRKKVRAADEPPPAPIGNRAFRGKGVNALTQLMKAQIPVTVYFPDRHHQPNAMCMSCRSRSDCTYEGKYHLCNGCALLSVGIPLNHPKIHLIIELRREVDVIRIQKKSIEEKNDSMGNLFLAQDYNQLNTRINEIDKVLHRLTTTL
jgi:hypothetical protein